MREGAAEVALHWTHLAASILIPLARVCAGHREVACFVVHRTACTAWGALPTRLLPGHGVAAVPVVDALRALRPRHRVRSIVSAGMPEEEEDVFESDALSDQGLEAVEEMKPPAAALGGNAATEPLPPPGFEWGETY